MVGHHVRMKRVLRWIPAALLLATGVNGLIWLVGLLAAQGLDRAEKILSVVAVPATIAIGGVGLWLARPVPRPPAGADPADAGRAGRTRAASRYGVAAGLVVSLALNAVLLYVYLPSRLPELGPEIRVGVSGLHPGWSKSNNGESIESATGFDMDLVAFLKKRFTGNTWRVVQVDPVDREKSIVTGEVDLVVANYSMEGSAAAYPGLGLQRRDMIDFAGPYFVDTSGIMVNRKKNPAGTKVPTAKLCVAKGTTAGDYIAATDSAGKSRAQYREQQECFNRFMNPKDLTIVATVTDSMILKARAWSTPGRPPVLQQPDRDGTVRTEKYGIGLPNRRPKLCAALNEAIAAFLTSDGELGWNQAWDRHLSQLGEEPKPHRPATPEPRCPATA
jgi:glutamate transport system substrate-binding protein